METPSQPTTRLYLVPCMLTISSLFSGFYSMIAAINGHFQAAAIAILVAGVFDALDGRVARMTGSTSTFGMELDSLCDIVSFGVAPGLLAYLWALTPYGRYGWLAGFLYVATTALRLARFNVQTSSEESDGNFTGLPCPAAACMIATAVLFSTVVLNKSDPVRHISLLLLVYLLSYLMISTHRYPSFKHFDIPKEKRFHAFAVMILLLVLLASEPHITLGVVALLYVLSGPSMDIYKLVRGKSKKPWKFRRTTPSDPDNSD
ncbi:MAG: CDP-diacylglycerol--serine O-phosphatidyltransferase [Desulfobulbaceae bacterium]|nr:CDP-diacylglycerol--serine O-phosphatidyltransferase [Desulfobulbaceae bacterium]